MTEQTPSPNPAEAPIDPLSTHPASPFLRTEAPEPVAFASPPSPMQVVPATSSTWVIYRTQIEFGLAMLAYLMVLVGSVVVVPANPQAACGNLLRVGPGPAAAFADSLLVPAPRSPAHRLL